MMNDVRGQPIQGTCISSAVDITFYE